MYSRLKNICDSFYQAKSLGNLAICRILEGYRRQVVTKTRSILPLQATAALLQAAHP